MAFQAGTQIRPELANADYSGFANAANIRAQSMMNLGQQIAGGIEKYQKNKQIKGELTGQIEGAINTDPGLLASLEQLEEVSSAVKKMQDGKASNNDLFMVQGAISSIQKVEQRQNQVRLQALQEQMLQNQIQQGPELNLQSPKTFVTPEGEKVFGAFDPKTGQILAVGSNAPLPQGSVPAEKPTSGSQGSPKMLKLPDGTFVQAVYDPATNQNIQVGTGKVLPDGAIETTATAIFEQNLDPADKAAREATGKLVAKEVADWQDNKAFAAEKNLRAINTAFKALASGEANTRTWVEFVPNIGGFRDSARGLIRPTDQAAYDNVVSVVATTLREALGAQFTEKEGTRILNASFNPQLPVEDNLNRLVGIASVISATIEAKNARVEAFYSEGVEAYQNLPSPSEVFETQLSIYENMMTDTDRSMGIAPAANASKSSGIRIKSIKRN